MAKRKATIMSSLSRDGELQAHILAGFGYRIVRGSASRGGARGLIGMKRGMRDGYHAGLAVDGPKGPIHEVKPGVIYLAKKTGAPVIPVLTSANEKNRCSGDSCADFSKAVHCHEKDLGQVHASCSLRQSGHPFR
jgi:lysophospholipid acyltransferase (LPLAT)-like uncharacterized protein